MPHLQVISKDALRPLMSVLLCCLVDEMVGVLPEGMAMLKALNLLMMKILENSDRCVAGAQTGSLQRAQVGCKCFAFSCPHRCVCSCLGRPKAAARLMHYLSCHMHAPTWLRTTLAISPLSKSSSYACMHART